MKPIIQLFRTYFLHLSILLATLFLMIGICEIVCRFYYTGKLTYHGSSYEDSFWKHDTQTGWSHIPHAAGRRTSGISRVDSSISFDEHGLRKTNEDAPSAPEKTILFLGDSTTAGFEVDDDETYPAVLERLFRDSGRSVRCYNGGVRGFGTDQCLFLLMKLQDIIRPDYVVYMFTSNDVIDNRTIKRPDRMFGKPAFILNNNETQLVNYPAEIFPKNYYSWIELSNNTARRTEGMTPLQAHHPLYTALKQFTMEHFVLYDLLAMHKRTLLSILSTKKKPVLTSLPVSTTDYDRALLSILLRKMRSVNPHILITKFSTGETTEYDDHLSVISQEIHIPFLSLAHAFPPGKRYTPPFEGHWNELGHQKAAEALYQYFDQLIVNTNE